MGMKTGKIEKLKIKKIEMKKAQINFCVFIHLNINN